jgi:uncharacterized protein (DUF2132 family)
MSDFACRPSHNESFHAVLTLSLHGITIENKVQQYKQNTFWEALRACIFLSAFICNRT